MEGALTRHFRAHARLEMELYASYSAWASSEATRYVHDGQRDACRLSQFTLDAAKIAGIEGEE
jgi:hypothetical protein